MYRRSLIFWSACMGMLLFGIAMITLGSVIPDLRLKTGMDEISAGTLFSILPIGILFGSLLFGPIVDRRGYKVLLSISSLLLFGGFEGLAYSRSEEFLRLFVLVIGLGGGAINGAANALVSDISEQGKGANLSLLGVFFGLGALGMPLISGLLKNLINYQLIISSVGVLSLGAAILFLLLQFPPPKQEQGFPLGRSLHLLKDKLLILISLFLFFESSFEGIINNWTTSFILNRFNVGMNKALFGLSSFVAGMTVMRIITGGFLRSVQEKKLLSGCFVLILSGLILVKTVNYYPALVAGLFILGAGLACGFPLMLGFIGVRFPDLSGTAFSIALVIALIGNMTVNYGMGYIAKIYGINNLTSVAFAEFFVMLALLLLIFRKLNRTE